MIIGICGKSGCGKSTLANKLINETKNKAVHLDIDKVGHDVLEIEEVKKELVREFGISIIQDNKINRKNLSYIVFDSKESMEKLNNITWKHMQIKIDEFIEQNKDSIIILDWLLLPVTKYFDMCDMKILLDVPYEIRLERALKRDNISAKDFELREKASFNYNELDFDLVLDNNYEVIINEVKLI